MNTILENRISLVKKIISESKYTARTWDREDAFRYVFSIMGNILEGAFFIHYKEDKILKYVIELSISYGCPIKCKHCASGAIDTVKQLTASEITEMFHYMTIDNNVASKQRILVTYSGIGEGALQRKNLKLASLKILNTHPKAYFNFSTVGYDASFISFCSDISKIIELNHIQITYLHYDTKELSKIIPNPDKLGFCFEELIHSIEKNDYNRSRINYILIEGYNDSQVHFNTFIKLIKEVKNKIIIRVSKLNDTSISIKNGLKSPPFETLVFLHSKLENEGFNTHIFTPETNNNMNCGQLSWNYGKNQGEI